jgi:site-specific recombinase XerD
MFRRHHWPYPDLSTALTHWASGLVCEPDTRRIYTHLLTIVLAETDLTRLRVEDLAQLVARITTHWTKRGTRNVARSALRAFLCWGCTQEIGHRSLTPEAILDALPMEPRPPDQPAALTPALPLAALRTLLPTLPSRTRALVVLAVATGLPITHLVALQLSDVTPTTRGISLHLPIGDRELAGEAIGEVSTYVTLRQAVTAGDATAPLFAGSADQALTPNYARKLLSQVAQTLGISTSLTRVVSQHAGGIGGW